MSPLGIHLCGHQMMMRSGDTFSLNMSSLSLSLYPFQAIAFRSWASLFPCSFIPLSRGLEFCRGCSSRSASQAGRHSVLSVGLLWCQTKPHNIPETNYILLLHALRNIPLNPSHTHASSFAYRFLTPVFVAQSSNTRYTTVYIIGCWLVQPHHIENVSCVG